MFISILLSTLLSISPATIEWLTPTHHDFGDILHKRPVFHQFTFINHHADSIFIDNVRVDCGCTTPNWEEKAIAPSDTAFIEVEYDAEDKGYFEKKIKVYFSHERKPHRLQIEGWVEGN